MKSKQKKIIVANTETGEVHELTPLKPNKPIHIDKKQKFIKFYYNLINILPTLSKAELIIIKSICENLKPNKIAVGNKAEISLFTTTEEWTFTKESIQSKSKNSAFLGQKIKGKAIGIYNNGQLVRNK